MQRLRFVLCPLFLAVLLAFPAWTAAQNSSPEAILNRISAHLDKSTIFVGHFDLKKLDLEKSVSTLRTIVGDAVKKADMPKDVKDMIQPMITEGFNSLEPQVQLIGDGFTVSGCEEVYFIVNSMTLAQCPARILVVFAPSADSKVIDGFKTGFLASSPGARFTQKDGLLVVDPFSPQLSAAQIKEAEKFIDAFDKSRKPLVRPELLAAIERTKSAPFKLAFAVDDGLKGMFQMFYSMTPPEIQQMLPAKTLLDGAEWISLGVDVNRWIIDLNIKGKNPAASKALYDAIIKLKNDALTQAMADFPGQEKAMNSQIMPFIPKVQEDRLRLTINQKFLDDNLPNILQYALPAVIAAQRGGIQLPFE